MAYDIYVNETYVGPLVGAGGFSAFIDWAETFDVKKYEEIVTLAEHSLVAEVDTLAAQLKLALKNDPPPAAIKPMVRRILAATEKTDPKGDDNVLWITDGADGMLEAMLGQELEERGDNEEWLPEESI